MDDMDIKNIMICLEQRNIFILKLLNMTKQLEVKSQQEDVVFDDLLERRQDCMDRIDKCNQMIQADLSFMTDEKAVAIKSILESKTQKADCPYEWLQAYELVMQYNEMLLRTLGIDQAASAEIKSRHSDLKEKINAIRKQQRQN